MGYCEDVGFGVGSTAPVYRLPTQHMECSNGGVGNLE